MKYLFHDYINVKGVSVPKTQRNQFSDKVLSSIEKQKDSISTDMIQGLKIRSIDTHSARLTGHFHYYPPVFVKEGAPTFTHPFNKPVLLSHQEDNDPIGRVQVATYVATPPSVIPSSIYNTISKLKDHTTKSARKSIDKIRMNLYDTEFEGFGYIETLSNITDEAAILKLIDGRYHTISVGYSTDSLTCSECGVDWVADGAPCDHQKGVDYGKGPMFLIFGELSYGEKSYVNSPADELAQNIDISLAEFQSKLSSIDSSDVNAKAQYLDALASDSLRITDPFKVATSKAGLYYYDCNDECLIPQSKFINNKTGENMTIKDLKDSKELLSKITELVAEENRLSDEDMNALEDKDYLGAGHSFPIPNEEYRTAVKTVIEETEDSDEKTELLEFLSQVEGKASTDNTDADKNKDNTDSNDTDTNTEDETNTDVKVEDKDYVSYQFKLEAGNWGLPDEEDKSTDAEKAILTLLLSMYAKSDEDALEVINSILAGVENKDNIVVKLAADQLQSLESRVDNYKAQEVVWKDSVTLKDATIASVTEELKDMIATKLVSFQDKEDPNQTKEDILVKFKDQSLSELKATLGNIELLNGGVNAIVEEKDTTLNFDNDNDDEKKPVTEDEVNQLAASNELVYVNLMKTDSAHANMYKAHQDKKIRILRANLKASNAEEDKNVDE